MPNRELNDLKRKLYKLQADLLAISKALSKTEIDLANALKIENDIDAVNLKITRLEND